MPTGNPIYSQEIADEICAALEQGINLEEICRREHMPAASTVHSWTAGNVASVPPSFAIAIARAREVGYDAIAANCRDTARGRGDSMQDVQRDKLIIETDLKLLAKWSPKKYGDRVAVDQTLHAGDSVAEILRKRIEQQVPDGDPNP